MTDKVSENEVKRDDQFSSESEMKFNCLAPTPNVDTFEGFLADVSGATDDAKCLLGEFYNIIYDEDFDNNAGHGKLMRFFNHYNYKGVKPADLRKLRILRESTIFSWDCPEKY